MTLAPIQCVPFLKIQKLILPTEIGRKNDGIPLLNNLGNINIPLPNIIASNRQAVNNYEQLV